MPRPLSLPIMGRQRTRQLTTLGSHCALLSFSLLSVRECGAQSYLVNYRPTWVTHMSCQLRSLVRLMHSMFPDRMNHHHHYQLLRPPLSVGRCNLWVGVGLMPRGPFGSFGRTRNFTAAPVRSSRFGGERGELEGRGLAGDLHALLARQLIGCDVSCWSYAEEDLRPWNWSEYCLA